MLSQTGSFLGYVGSDREVTAVAWLDDDRVAALHTSGVEIFSTSTGNGLVAVDFPAGEAFAVDADGLLVAAATATGDVHVIDADSGGSVATLDHPVVVRDVAFSPSGDRVATGDRAGTLRLWNASDGSLLAEVDAHPEQTLDEAGAEIPEGARHEPATLPVGVHRIAFNPDGTEIATTGGFFIRTWDATTLQARSQIHVERPLLVDATRRTNGRPFDIEFGQDGQVVVAVEGFLQSWRLESGELLGEIAVSLVVQSGFESFSLDVVGPVAVLGLPNGSLVEFDFLAGELGEPLLIAEGSRSEGFDAAVSPDGRTIAAAASGVALFARDGRQLIARSIPGVGLDELFLSTDGTLATTLHGLRGGPLPALWDVSTPVPQERSLPDNVLRVYPDLMSPLAFQRVSDNAYFPVDPESLEPTGFDFGTMEVWSTQVSPDGRLVALGRGQPFPPSIDIFDLGTGERIGPQLNEFVGPNDSIVTSVAWSPDNSRLAASTDSGAAFVWDTTTWERVGPAIAEGGGIALAVAYSPDGQHLLTVDSNGAINLRDADTYQPTGRQFLGATRGLPDWRDIAFTVDGRYLVTTLDEAPRVYDFATGTLIGAAFPGDVGGGASVRAHGLAASSIVNGRA